MNPDEYTAREDAVITVLRRQGYTYKAIATVLKRPSGVAIRQRYEKIQQRTTAHQRSREPVEYIPCMTCRNPFPSTDRKAHRRCDNCRKDVTETVLSGYTL